MAHAWRCSVEVITVDFDVMVPPKIVFH